MNLSVTGKMYLLYGIGITCWVFCMVAALVWNSTPMVVLGFVLFSIFGVPAALTRCDSCGYPIQRRRAWIFGIQFHYWSFPPAKCERCGKSLTRRSVKGNSG